MGGAGRRWLLGLVGIAVFAVYAAGAAGSYLLLSWLLSDPSGLVVAVTVTALLALVAGYLSYRHGPARVLAGIESAELPRRRAPGVYRRLDGLAREMDVQAPPILVADLGVPNALSLGGPRHGVVVLDRAVLSLLTVDELEGILAHELAHMERNDTFVQTLAVTLLRTLAGVLSLVVLPLLLLARGVDRGSAWASGRPDAGSDGLAGDLQRGVTVLVSLVLGPLVLALLAHARRREFAADRRAAEVTGRPAALARALSKIHRAANPEWGIRSLLYVTGERRRSEGMGRVLSTHPPIEERIERLVGPVK
jgi:heat shock protein HtpX